MEKESGVAAPVRKLVDRVQDFTRREGSEWHEVLRAERELIEEIRALEDGLGRTAYWGLAHSGGGIRSAAFSIGAEQALFNRGLMRHFDYLSTVSGGGYTGSALTWFLCRGVPSSDTPESTPCRESADAGCREGPRPWSDDDFPFGRRRRADHGEGSEPNLVLNFIRQQAKYLTPGKGLNLISFLAVVVQGMLASLITYSLLLVSFFTLATRRGWYDPFRIDDAWPVIGGLVGEGGFGLPNVFFALALLLGIVVVVFAVSSVVRTSLPLSWLSRYSHAIWRQRFLGGVWTALGGTLLVAAIGPVAKALPGADVGGLMASVSGTVGGVLGFFQFRSEQRRSTTRTAPLSRLRIYGAVGLLLFGLLLGTYYAGDWYQGLGSWSLWWPFVAFLALGLIVNLNYSGPGRMYRDRLMETFLPDADRVVRLEWGKACAADRAPLSAMVGHRPYHLVNTNLVLVDSKRSKYRGRGGDSFVLAPLHCGGEADGWHPTEDFNRTTLSPRGMTLGTAMAISAAAVNPNTGVAGAGVTRSTIVSVLMGLLNLRLGYWVPDPHRKALLAPNFVFPGLLGGLLGIGLSEDARHLELTDGGHFENLGLYELFRRRVRVIVVTDGGADPGFRFGDLANAMERARVDFGTKVRFRPGKGLGRLRPGSGAADAVLPKEELSERGHAVADVWYAGDPEDAPGGVLYYLKSTLVADLPADVLGYRRANPEFPDQSTADQFFDEAQFEAYRELGYQLAVRMLDEEDLTALANGPDRAPVRGTEPPDVAEARA